MEEAEWAIEVMKATGKPVVMCLNICLAGDFEGVPVDECAVRIAKAGNGEIILTLQLKIAKTVFKRLLLKQ